MVTTADCALREADVRTENGQLRANIDLIASDVQIPDSQPAEGARVPIPDRVWVQRWGRVAARRREPPWRFPDE